MTPKQIQSGRRYADGLGGLREVTHINGNALSYTVVASRKRPGDVGKKKTMTLEMFSRWSSHEIPF